MDTNHDQASNLREMILEDGRSLYELSFDQRVLLVFLRHLGCTFCREAVADLSARQNEFESEGVQLVLVHMSDKATAAEHFKKYKLNKFLAISDPELQFYEKFGLGKGSFNQLFGLRVWMRGFDAGVLHGHGIGRMMGDGFQMPGMFLLQDGMIKEKFIHQYASDRPDYVQFISCCDV